MRYLVLALYLTGLFFWLAPVHAAAKKSSWLSISILRSQYSDIKSTSNAGTESADEDSEGSAGVQGLEPTNDVELDFRIRNYFSLGLVAGQAIRGDETAHFGAGLRIDTPGFFFFGGNPSKEVRSSMKRYPVNTSLFAFLIQQIHKPDGASVANRYVGSNIGMSMDIFLFNPSAFVTTQASVFNTRSNAFFCYSFGLGFEF